MCNRSVGGLSPLRGPLATGAAEAEYTEIAARPARVVGTRVAVRCSISSQLLLAKNAGLNRESLYKALGETGNPEFGTVTRIVRAMGLTLSARTAEAARKPKKRRVA